MAYLTCQSVQPSVSASNSLRAHLRPSGGYLGTPTSVDNVLEVMRWSYHTSAVTQWSAPLWASPTHAPLQLQLQRAGKVRNIKQINVSHRVTIQKKTSNVYKFNFKGFKKRFFLRNKFSLDSYALKKEVISSYTKLFFISKKIIFVQSPSSRFHIHELYVLFGIRLKRIFPGHSQLFKPFHWISGRKGSQRSYLKDLAEGLTISCLL